MAEKEFSPEDFDKEEPQGSTVAQQFEEKLQSVDELPEEQRSQYEKMASFDETPEAEDSSDLDDEGRRKAFEAIAALATSRTKLTDEMRETFIRSLMGNQPYSHTFKFNRDRIKIKFRTLSVNEHDAVATAIADYSKHEGFESATHLQFMNYKYVMACALQSVTLTDDDEVDTIHLYESPLEDYTEDYVEKEVTTKQLDGTSKTKVIREEVKDCDRVVQAYDDRFKGLDSNLYNLILNAYSSFERQVNDLSVEMYKENFT